MTCPSTSGIGAAGHRRRDPALRRGMRRQLGAVHLTADRDPLGPEAERRGEPAAVLDHRSGSSSVRTPRLRPSKGGSLTPPRRVVKAAVAPGSCASSQRTPSASRHSIVAPRHLQRHRQLLLASTRSRRRACAAAPPARPRPSAGPCGSPGGDQVLAVDLEGNVTPLDQIAIEPLGAQRPGKHELDRIVPDSQGDCLRGTLWVASWPGPPLRPAGPSAATKQGALARRQSIPGPRPEQLGRPESPARHRSAAQLHQTPLGEQGEGATAPAAPPASRSSSASRRSAETRAQIGRPQKRLGLAARARSRSGRRSGQHAERAVGSSSKERECRTRRSPASRSPRPPYGSISRDSPCSGIAIALIVKSRRARSASTLSAGSTTGSAPGCGIALRSSGGDVDLVAVERRPWRCAKRSWETTSAPSRTASPAASPTTTRSTSARPRPSSRSRTAPPTR